MIRQIKFRHSDGTFEHDDTADEAEIRAAEPLFFKTKHSKRETYTFYRGFVIVRTTVTFSDGVPRRMTALYVYSRKFERGPGTLNVRLEGDTVRAAKRAADEVLETGRLDRQRTLFALRNPERAQPCSTSISTSAIAATGPSASAPASGPRRSRRA